ncbi:MAG: sigma factor-like helix-turn-helix DNA-binding protein [Gammaproteobacteria bacterium]
MRYDSDLVSKVTDRPLEAWVVDADSQEALHERLAQLLKQLPAPVQSAFLLAKRDGVRHKVIAHRMGVSISTINKYVRDAVLFLKNADWDEDTETKERKRR